MEQGKTTNLSDPKPSNLEQEHEPNPPELKKSSLNQDENLHELPLSQAFQAKQNVHPLPQHQACQAKKNVNCLPIPQASQAKHKGYQQSSTEVGHDSKKLYFQSIQHAEHESSAITKQQRKKHDLHVLPRYQIQKPVRPSISQQDLAGSQLSLPQHEKGQPFTAEDEREKSGFNIYANTRRKNKCAEVTLVSGKQSEEEGNMSQLFDWNVKDSETQRTVDQDNKRISKRKLEEEKASVESKKRRTLVKSTSNRETEAAIMHKVKLEKVTKNNAKKARLKERGRSYLMVASLL
jgi:hypothetical protein